MYYPRNPNIVRCKEMFELDTYQHFLVDLNKFVKYCIKYKTSICYIIVYSLTFRTGHINLLDETLNTDSIPYSILNATVTNELVKKFQNFESNAPRTQLCINRSGISKAVLTKNLPPLNASLIREPATCGLQFANNSSTKQLGGILVTLLHFIIYFFQKLFSF